MSTRAAELARPRRLTLPAETAAAAALGLGLSQIFGRPDLGAWALLLLAGFAALLWRDPRAEPGRRTRRGALLGFGLGLGWFLGGVWWIDVSLSVYGGMSQLLAAPAVALFGAGLALFPAASAAVAARLSPPASGLPWSLRQGLGAASVLAGAMTLTELARGVVFTGFPWLALGYSQVGDALSGYAPLLGVDGVGLALLAGAALLGLLSRVSVGGAAAAVALVAALGAGGSALRGVSWTRPSGPVLRVALLQGDVSQGDKFRPEQLAPTLQMYGRWLRDAGAGADLVVTPETALPVLPDALPDGWLAALDTTLRQDGTAALVGIPLTRGTDQYTNSAIGLGVGAPYRYDKHHLVPFGEFIPWGFHWFVRLMDMPLGDFARGGDTQPSYSVHGVRVAPTICYEDLFGAELARRFRDPATAPNVIANLTNLGWFGNTVALPQHLEIARMRSLEFQLPTVRATNTGATAIIDARGRVVASLPVEQPGVLRGSVEGRTGLTPYARIASRLGDLPLALLALLALLPGLRRRRGF